MSDRKLYGELPFTYNGKKIGRAYITGYDEGGIFTYVLIEDFEALTDITMLVEAGDLPSMSFDIVSDPNVSALSDHTHA